MAEPDEKLYGFREQLAERFGVGGDALHAGAERVLAAAMNGLAAYKGPMIRKETP